jgi:hypothetical protein
VKAGTDLELSPYAAVLQCSVGLPLSFIGCSYGDGFVMWFLPLSVQEGLITEAEIDVSVKRTLAVRLRLGSS